MECSNPPCWSIPHYYNELNLLLDAGKYSLSNYYQFPPEFPPPPPVPAFLQNDLETYLKNNNSSNLLGGSTCDLCDWAGASNPRYGASAGPLPLGTLLTIVAVVSALAGAGLTAAFLSVKRLRLKRLQDSSRSVRHLSRKYNQSSRPLSGTIIGLATSALTENTYCEGPYTENKESIASGSHNVYAELHAGNSGLQAPSWNRRPLPIPGENCYLELNDLPNCNRCTPATTPSTMQQYSPSSSTYYSDLDVCRQPTKI